MSRILCEFRFPTGEVKYGVWCDTADLLVTRRTFTSKEDAEQFRQRWQQEADEFCRGPIDSLVRDAVIEVARLDPGSLEGAYQTGVRSRDVQDMLGENADPKGLPHALRGTTSCGGSRRAGCHPLR